MVIYINNWLYGKHMLAMGPVSICDKTYLRKIWYFIMKPYIAIFQRRNVNSFQLPTDLEVLLIIRKFIISSFHFRTSCCGNANFLFQHCISMLETPEHQNGHRFNKCLTTWCHSIMTSQWQPRQLKTICEPLTVLAATFNYHIEGKDRLMNR